MNKIKLEFEGLNDQRVEGSAVLPLYSESAPEPVFDKEQMDEEELPLIATRDLVLFPNMTMPVVLGREFSIRVAKEADKNKRYVGLVAQINASVDEPTEADLYRVGCVAEVM